MQPVDAEACAQLARRLVQAFGGEHRDRRIRPGPRRKPAIAGQQQTALGTGVSQKIIVVGAVLGDRDVVAGGAQPTADALQHLVA